MPPSSAERRSPPQKWWSESTICTASGRHRRRQVRRKRSRTCWSPAARRSAAATSAIPSMPGVGSSRYSTTPASRLATLTEVAGVQAPLGSSRSGSDRGYAARSASIAAHSSSGGSTPPLSLSEPKPHPSTIRLAWRHDAVGVERLSPCVRLGAGVPGPFVEQVAAERHAVADRTAQQVAHRPAELPALHVQAGDLEGRVDGRDGGADVEHPAEGCPAPPVSRPSTSVDEPCAAPCRS